MNSPRRSKFPAKARLLKPADFKRVFKRSSVSADRFFKVLARRNESNCSRLGMAVSRQVDRHAVGRNRIKRVIRESFRLSFEPAMPQSGVLEAPEKSELENKGGFSGAANYLGMDLVVLPRREAATICNRELFQSLNAHWSRLRHKTGLKQETR